MSYNKQKVIVAVTGASGAIYARHLIEKLLLLREQIDDAAIIFSDNGKDVWNFEESNYKISDIPFTVYPSNDFYAPFASGSSNFNTMIVCPCSMGTLGRIANGVSDGLITRAADVILKERRKLILVTREMPLNLIHINNMKIITLAGGIICPASPSFYSNPDTIDSLIATVIDRVLNLAGFELNAYQWGKHE